MYKRMDQTEVLRSFIASNCHVGGGLLCRVTEFRERYMKANGFISRVRLNAFMLQLGHFRSNLRYELGSKQRLCYHGLELLPEQSNNVDAQVQTSYNESIDWYNDVLRPQMQQAWRADFERSLQDCILSGQMKKCLMDDDDG